MLTERTTLTQFLIEERRRYPGSSGDQVREPEGDRLSLAAGRHASRWRPHGW